MASCIEADSILTTEGRGKELLADYLYSNLVNYLTRGRIPADRELRLRLDYSKGERASYVSQAIEALRNVEGYEEHAEKLLGLSRLGVIAREIAPNFSLWVVDNYSDVSARVVHEDPQMKHIKMFGVLGGGEYHAKAEYEILSEGRPVGIIGVEFELLDGDLEEAWFIFADGKKQLKAKRCFCCNYRYDQNLETPFP